MASTTKFSLTLSLKINLGPIKKYLPTLYSEIEKAVKDASKKPLSITNVLIKLDHAFLPPSTLYVMSGGEFKILKEPRSSDPIVQVYDELLSTFNDYYKDTDEDEKKSVMDLISLELSKLEDSSKWNDIYTVLETLRTMIIGFDLYRLNNCLLTGGDSSNVNVFVFDVEIN